MKQFRFSLCYAFTIPIALSFGFSYFAGKNNLTLYIVAFIAVLNELVFLNEIIDNNEIHEGIISSLIISSAISMLIYFSNTSQIMQFQLILGIAFVLAGCLLRSWAKITLGVHFSHTLRVIKEHKLIKYGLFRFIRHPAYSGTIILMTGFGLFLHHDVALLYFIIFFVLAMRRIEREEDMMKETFGQHYYLYSKHSWKLFPFII